MLHQPLLLTRLPASPRPYPQWCEPSRIPQHLRLQAPLLPMVSRSRRWGLRRDVLTRLRVAMVTGL
ncbi:uncharacterized protein BKA55DRAFT_562387 [Fusarium redolens]|uniref:Uncharacterized protein n=1 Tax=Fusarium redolens TaxID=48865 RepID=A0A9P9HLV4_FUSRE|nr:uncharacterized protein BKA55DRAFT_562387 [Fusarium redolens]KAH7259328.1 hypothetical protein BKA55DRAFT_562387 [Fusarium redolens]